MSNIYIQEPPTSGKVLLVTSVGDIEVELWSKEAPRACRNFVQLCLEGYYDGTIFHRVVKGFIAQGGDPTGTGNGGESIYGAPFKDEFHSRLRFVRRGLVAMASGGADDNASQFFFTLGSCPDLQNKHTIFGKVVGETLYNMLRLEEGLVDADDRPLHPHRIISTQVLVNPFDDITPRKTGKKAAEDEPTRAQATAAATKNYKLLSFGEEAEEEEEELMAVVSKDPKGRSKSSHDLTDDASLSSVPAVVTDKEEEEEEEEGGFKRPTEPGAAERVRQRMREAASVPPPISAAPQERNYFEQERQKASAERIGAIRKEFQELKRQMRAEDQAKSKADKQPAGGKVEEQEEEDYGGNQLMRAYRQEQRAYAEKQQQLLPKGASREKKTLEALARFQAKIATLVDDDAKEAEDDAQNSDGDDDDDNSDRWLAHRLHFSEQGPVLARDANSVNAEEAYSIDDPRNAMNERRRKRPHHDHGDRKRHK